MLTQKKVIQILRNNSSYLKKTYKVNRIGLFGSFAKGIENKDSDVDILVELEKPIGLEFIKLADYIEDLLGRKVDILTPEGIRSIRFQNVAKNIMRNILYV